MLEIIVNIIDSIAFYLLMGFVAVLLVGAVIYVVMKNLRGF